jgi:hypothetical protein
MQVHALGRQVAPSFVAAEADRADGCCLFQGELVDALNLDQSLKDWLANWLVSPMRSRVMYGFRQFL